MPEDYLKANKKKSTGAKGSFPVPSEFGPEGKRFAMSVNDSLQQLTGEKGNKLDAAVTFGDLENIGLIEKNVIKSTGGKSFDLLPVTDRGIDFPTAPTGASIDGAFKNIIIDWDYPNYAGHSHTEIFVADTNSFASAEVSKGRLSPKFLGQTTATVFSHGVGTGVNKYYWIRHVNQNDVAGPVHSTSGLNAQTTLIDTDSIADAAIVNAKIANAAIDSAKIADAAITNAKIANAQITNSKIANASIDTVKIIDGSISTAKIGSAAVTSAKIGSAAITQAKIGNAAVDTLQIAGEAVTIPSSANAGANASGIATVSTSITMPVAGSAVVFLTFNGAYVAFGGSYIYIKRGSVTEFTGYNNSSGGVYITMQVVAAVKISLPVGTSTIVGELQAYDGNQETQSANITVLGTLR